MTPYRNKNPAFTVIDFDQEFMIAVSIKTYYMDIDEANKNDKPEWKLLKDFAPYYNLTDLSPSSIYTLGQKVMNEESTAIDYEWNKSRKVRG